MVGGQRKWLPWRAVRALPGMILLAAILMGAECQPSDPSCAATDGGGVLECGTGEVRTCLSRCVPLGGIGASCKDDPCSTQHVCENGLACIEDECQPTPALALLECDPTLAAGQPETCASGTYCTNIDACGETTPKWLATVDPDGMCVLPMREGERCLGDWTDLTSSDTHCRICEPGTECIEHPTLEVPLCQRPCSGDEDCPCGVECVSGHCDVPCLENRAHCTLDGLTCCDQAASCNAVSIPGVGTMTISERFCCRDTDASCTFDSDCCPNSVCHAGKCTVCGSYPGDSPQPGAPGSCSASRRASPRCAGCRASTPARCATRG